ncbi:hypothetical protein [Spirosoma aerophilum]
MQRRNFPSILLYGFGLALALSLGFNGFLLYEQSQRLSLYEYEAGYSAHPVDMMVWQQQLSDCKRANEQKDSLISHLEKTPNAPPDQAAVVHQMSSR